MTTNLFVTANVKKIANLGSFRILLPFFSTSWCVRVINSAIFNSFHNRVEFGTIFEGLSKFRGGVEHPKSPPPSVRHWYELQEKMLVYEECCAAYVDSWLRTFRDSILVLTSSEKQFCWID